MATFSWRGNAGTKLQNVIQLGGQLAILNGVAPRKWDVLRQHRSEVGSQKRSAKTGAPLKVKAPPPPLPPKTRERDPGEDAKYQPKRGFRFESG